MENTITKQLHSLTATSRKAEYSSWPALVNDHERSPTFKRSGSRIENLEEAHAVIAARRG